MIHVMHNGRIRIQHGQEDRYGLKFRIRSGTCVFMHPGFPGCYVTGRCPARMRTYRAARNTYRRNPK